MAGDTVRVRRSLFFSFNKSDVSVRNTVKVRNGRLPKMGTFGIHGQKPITIDIVWNPCTLKQDALNMGNQLILTNDNEFLRNKIIDYPDMSLTTWTIRKRGVKPNHIVDSGCVKEKRMHLRMK